MRIHALCGGPVFLLYLLLSFLLAKGDAEGESWLCDRVRSMAVKNPHQNIIGFAEGTFNLLDVVAVERAEFPVGCVPRSTEKPKGGIGNVMLLPGRFLAYIESSV